MMWTETRPYVLERNNFLALQGLKGPCGSVLLINLCICCLIYSKFRTVDWGTL